MGLGPFFFTEAKEHVKAQKNRLVVFTIGSILYGQEIATTAKQHNTAVIVVGLYMDCIKRARNAVLCWLLCARNKCLYRDVSQLVAHLVWNERHAFLTFD